MICDHYINSLERCANTPNRAPFALVPCQFGREEKHPDYRPLKLWTLWHFCELHTGVVTLDTVLTAKEKRGLEIFAKQRRALDFQCDFEKAELDWELTTTPEYRRYLAKLGYHGVMGAAKLDQYAQQQLRERLGVISGGGL